MSCYNKLFEIGEKIYPIDLSYLRIKHDINYEFCESYEQEEEIRDKLENKNPFVVLSLPYENEIPGFNNLKHYFIDVKFEDSDEIYSILNNKLIHKEEQYWNYLKYIDDARICSSFGY